MAADIHKMTSQEFESLFMRNKDRFIMIARSYVRSQTAAEDIVAEAFGKYWECHENIELTGTPEAYIMATVKNRCLNYLRDSMTHLRIEQKMHTDAYKALIAETEFLASEDLGFLFESDVEKIFKDCLSSMSGLTREIFMASRFDGLTYNEIAEKYGITPRKVKRDISAVLEKMRRSLKDYLL